MTIVDEVLARLQVQIDSLWYNLLLSLAGTHWSVQRAFLMMGYTLELMNQWLVENAFTPLIQQTNASLQIAVSMAFVVALLVLGITYLLAAFARMRVVEPRSALAWYLAGALFFALGPQLYQGMSDFRRTLSGAFYSSSLNGLQASTGSAFTSLNNVNSSDLGLLPLCDNFGSYLPVWNRTVDGLDVALAYLRADGIDIMGYPSTPRDLACPVHPADPFTGTWMAGALPWEWRQPGSFFSNVRDPVFFETMTGQERADSIGMASSAHGRLLTAWPLILFGVTEQLVYLLLTVAQGITFMSFGIAILFAFFKKTEVIARSIIDLWIELIVQTVVIALIQSLVVTFFLTGTASNNSIVVLGVGLICLIFMIIVLWSGVKAVWNSFNRLFNAFGQATGGAVASPGAAATMAAVGTAGIAAGAVGLGVAGIGGMVSVGSNALAGKVALERGATPAQAAGLTFGGVEALARAARTLTHLPGLRNTPLGDAAEQFTEAAYTRRLARDVPLVGALAGPVVGGMLLTDRDPANADFDRQGRLVSRPMLVPAVGESLESWTLPDRVRKQANTTSGGSASAEDEENPSEEGTPRRKRVGTFTPDGLNMNEPVPSATHPPTGEQDAMNRERAAYADDMRGEEMEAHIRDTLQSRPLPGDADLRSEGTAERLERAAGMISGLLRVSGSADVASVMGDVLRLLAAERGVAERGAGGTFAPSVDHLTVASLIARAVGVTPLEDGKPPVRDDLARFGLFADRAARLGLTPEQTERVGREVKESPERRLLPETRTRLIDDAIGNGRYGREEAEREVSRLENAASLLPHTLTVYGSIPMPSVTVIPQITVNPSTPATERSAYDQAVRLGAAMGGSQPMRNVEEE